MGEAQKTQTPQTQKKDPLIAELPDEIVEMFEYEIAEGRYRKCVDSDFAEMISALALSVDGYYDYVIRKVGGWYVIHTWVPGSGDDFAILLKIDRDTGEVEECVVIDSTMVRL